MKNAKMIKIAIGALLTMSVLTVRADQLDDNYLRRVFDQGIRFTDKIEFPGTIGAAGDPVVGQGQFGLSADGQSIDPTRGGIIDGVSVIAGQIHPNGRTCASCHRPGAGLFLGLPSHLPLSDTISMGDPLFSGISADAGDEPLAFDVFNNFGLVHHVPSRFNPILPDDSPFKQVFFWRKAQHIINTVFTFGFLNEGRARDMTELTRGAMFTHTQNGNARFDDLANPLLNNISAFMEQQIDPPELKALLNPNDPMYQTLVNDPFYTVHATTRLERRGQKVFAHACMSCHNMPNVFSNRDHVDGPPLNFAPHVGHAMDIGVAQANMLKLEFRRYDAATGQRVPIVMPLTRQDGVIVNYTIKDDVGEAAATGRYEDLHRFKIPQLRHIAALGPYFHDNSVSTLEGVVQYFNSDAYNNSPDGQMHPIHLSGSEQQALLAFLRIL